MRCGPPWAIQALLSSLSRRAMPGLPPPTKSEPAGEAPADAAAKAIASYRRQKTDLEYRPRRQSPWTVLDGLPQLVTQAFDALIEGFFQFRA